MCKRLLPRIKIFYNNCRGLNGKIETLVDICNIKSPDVICLVETNSKREGSFNKYLTGYGVIDMVKEGSNNGGGILLAYNQSKFTNAMVMELNDDNTILSVKLSLSNGDSIIITVIYGYQETENAMKVKEFYELVDSICKNFSKQHHVIVGDLNAKIGLHNQTVSRNGRKLLEVIKKRNLSVINGTDKCEGKWTRIPPNGTSPPSIIDYVITNNWEEKRIEKMLIDEERRWALRVFSKDETCPSDHVSIFVEYRVENFFLKDNKRRERIVFDENGWERYQSLTENLPEVKDSSFDSILKYIRNAVFKSFRKVRISKRTKPFVDKRVSELLKKFRTLEKTYPLQKDVIQEVNSEISNLINDNRKRKALEKMAEISSSNKLVANKFWRVKNKMSAKHINPPISIKTDEGVDISKPEDINREFDKEFQRRLAQRTAAVGYEEVQNEIDTRFNTIMEESMKRRVEEFNMKELNIAIKKIDSNTSPDPNGISSNMLKRAGEGLKKLILKWCNFVLKNGLDDKERQQVIIKPIFKKGSRFSVRNYRGVFMTSLVDKIMERMIYERVKAKLFANCNIFQSGGIPGRTTTDNLLLIRAVSDYRNYLGQDTVLVFYDFQTAFDSLWLRKCIVDYYEKGIRDEHLGVIYDMNKKCKVNIKTNNGLSEGFTLDEAVKQGTILSPSLCVNSIGRMIDKCQENAEVIVYAGMEIPPLGYVDDICDIKTSLLGALKSSIRLQHEQNRSKMLFNPAKCEMLYLGKKRKEKTIEVNGTKIPLVESAKYLGRHISNSQKMIFSKMIQKARSATYDIIHILNETCMFSNTLRVQTGLLLYNTMWLPKVLYGEEIAPSWSASEAQEIQREQVKFLKRMLRVPKSTSSISIFAELGILPIEAEKEKIKMFYFSQRAQKAQVIQSIIERMSRIPGRNWMTEVEELCERYSLGMEEMKETNIEEAIRARCLRMMKDECTSKTSRLLEGKLSYQQENYLKESPNAIKIFKARSGCEVAWTSRGGNCRVCYRERETTTHVYEQCPIAKAFGVKRLFSHSTAEKEMGLLGYSRWLKIANL